MKIIRLALLATALLQTSCSRIDFAIVNFPTYFDAIKVKSDIAYGPREDEKLDIYLPASAAPAPVVVFFYGGRWENGQKSFYTFVGKALSEQGFVVVIPDYRKYPDVKFPAFVEDAAAAIAWTDDHIADYHGDPAQLNVAGHSSGAHIGALAVTDPRYLAAFGKTRSIVKSFVGLAGPYDFVPDEPDIEDIFGPPANYPNMQVPHFVDGKEPPMLLLWGDKDDAVGRVNIDKLSAAIRDAKGCVATRIYPGIDHSWIVGSLSWLGDAPTLADMVDFMKHPQCQR